MCIEGHWSDRTISEWMIMAPQFHVQTSDHSVPLDTFFFSFSISVPLPPPPPTRVFLFPYLPSFSSPLYHLRYPFFYVSFFSFFFLPVFPLSRVLPFPFLVYVCMSVCLYVCMYGCMFVHLPGSPCCLVHKHDLS